MRFLHGKVKAQARERISVQFSKPTRILIMPQRQFDKYRNNMTFTYYGGMKESPYEFTFPKAGNWVVVIEKGTYHNPMDITASITKMGPDPAALDSGRSKRKKNKKKKQKEDEAVAELDAAVAEEGSEGQSTE